MLKKRKFYCIFNFNFFFFLKSAASHVQTFYRVREILIKIPYLGVTNPFVFSLARKCGFSV